MTCIALLRGINVGGNKKVAMSDLRSLLTKAGFTGVQSLLQSGNLVFQSSRKTAGIERMLEATVAKDLGLRTDFMVRTHDEWKTVVSNNPFRKEAERDPGHLLVLFLKEAAALGNVKELQAGIVGRETIRADGRHLYAYYPDGVGRSRLTLALIEKKLGTRATGRNWNTVLKLAAASRSG